MSKRELDRLELIRRIEAKALSVVGAARLLGLSRSQVHRLVAAYHRDGAPGLISKRRNRPSNRMLSPAVRELSMALIGEHYADFGPTLAAEKLRERHGLAVSKETIRQWMIAEGLWITKAVRRRIYQPRNRRDCMGELVQIDGSLHHWFEDRADRCSLLVFIDDATSRIMHLRSCPSESTFDYMAAVRAYVAEHGKPTAFYSDKHTIFRTSKPAQKGTGLQGGMTQFGRALHELNIDILCAKRPDQKVCFTVPCVGKQMKKPSKSRNDPLNGAAPTRRCEGLNGDTFLLARVAPSARGCTGERSVSLPKAALAA